MEQKNIIITSEIDENYFIINTGAHAVSVLSSMLKNINEELSNRILEVSMIKDCNNQLLFIPKISILGIILENLKKNKQLLDDSEIITEKHLINASVKAITTEEISLEYQSTIVKMIKDKKTGTIEELKELYPESILKAINSSGRTMWFESDITRREYLKEIYLTGYETIGLTYYDNEWCTIDICSKSIIPLKSKGQKKERKITDKINK